MVLPLLRENNQFIFYFNMKLPLIYLQIVSLTTPSDALCQICLKWTGAYK